MSEHWVFVYVPRAGVTLWGENYYSSKKALERRFMIEGVLREVTGIEVATISGQSDVVRKNHSKYFNHVLDASMMDDLFIRMGVLGDET